MTSTNTPEIFKGVFLMLSPLLAAIYTIQGWRGEESRSLKRTLSFNLIPLFQGQGERVQIFKIKQNKEMPRKQPHENTLPLCFSTAWSKQRTEHPFLVRVCRWWSVMGSKRVLWFYYLFALCLRCDGQYSWLNPTPGDYLKDASLTLWQMHDFHLGKINNYWSLPMHCKILE